MLQLETDLSEWFAEAVFIASLMFAVVYIPFFEWKDTLTGRAVTILILAIAGTLFRTVLIIWGVIPFPKKVHPVIHGFWNNFLVWFSVISFGAAALAIIILIFETLRRIFSETDKKWLSKLLLLGKKFPR